MRRREAISACPPQRACLASQRSLFWRGVLTLGVLALFAGSAKAQIERVTDDNGRRFFVNAEPPVQPVSARSRLSFKGVNSRGLGGGSFGMAATASGVPQANGSRATIYLPAESSFTGHDRPAMSIDRDGVEKLVREASERHHMDPALVRAVIETESNWNPGAVSRKGAFGLMQLIPTTAQRFGVSDAFNPQQNVDAGVRYLKTLLERYNGTLDLALAAYNAGEGAVDRAHGVPSFRETQNYVQKVQNAYFRPGSGRIDGLWSNPRAIRKNTTPEGRTIFTND